MYILNLNNYFLVFVKNLAEIIIRET